MVTQDRTPLYVAPLCNAFPLRCSTLRLTPLSVSHHSTLLHSTLLHSTLLHSTLLHSTMLPSTMLPSTLLHVASLYVASLSASHPSPPHTPLLTDADIEEAVADLALTTTTSKTTRPSTANTQVPPMLQAGSGSLLLAHDGASGLPPSTRPSTSPTRLTAPTRIAHKSWQQGKEHPVFFELFRKATFEYFLPILFFFHVFFLTPCSIFSSSSK
jgi:hypothetical protein